MREKACLREVGPRDGLQLVRTELATEQKLEWCRREAAAGVSEVEVTSFVPARVVPQFADAAEVAAGALAIDQLTPAALVPNLKGAERALEVGLPKINSVLSASEEHNLADVRQTTEQSIDDLASIVELRNARGARAEIGAGIATAFGCTIAGNVAEKRVVEIAVRLVEAGADEIIVADTVGYGNPNPVRRIMAAICREIGDVPVACHFHDTRGLGLANVTAAVDVGVRSFDASLGGLGGCPFAPGASGNINSEGCVYLLESLGFDTGALIELRRTIEEWLEGENFCGSIAEAGLPRNFGQPLHSFT